MENNKQIVKEIKKESKILAFSSISKNLARMGYVARGLIYGIIGLLAMKVALGVSGSLEDMHGAIASIGNQLFGRILLIIILIGLIGYSLWGLIRAFFDPLNKGRNFKGILERIGYFMSAVVYGILIIPTYNFVFGASSANQAGVDGFQLKNIISTIFLMPMGRWIVGIIGVIVLGISLYQGYQGIRYNFDEQIKQYDLTFRQKKIIKTLGRFGTLARAVVSGVIGLFLIFAVYNASSTGTKGIDGALLVILQWPFGTWLLGIVAIGLISFGCYSILSGFWFKFKKSE
jgi:hypothetical protein